MPAPVSVSVSVEDQVNFRDQGRCAIEMPDGTKCGEAKWVHQHHIIPREHGGEDTLENLITLCAAHHRMVHKAIDLEIESEMESETESIIQLETELDMASEIDSEMKLEMESEIDSEMEL